VDSNSRYRSEWRASRRLRKLRGINLLSGDGGRDGLALLWQTKCGFPVQSKGECQAILWLKVVTTSPLTRPNWFARDCAPTRSVQQPEISPQRVLVKRQLNEDFRRFLLVLCDAVSSFWLRNRRHPSVRLSCSRMAPRIGRVAARSPEARARHAESEHRHANARVLGCVQPTSMAHRRIIFAQNPAATRPCVNLGHSIADRSVSLVCKPDSTRLADDGRDVVGDAHCLAGTCSGSDSGR
jgi:hypothetical protein